MGSKGKVIIIGASPRSIVNFRGELIKSFIKQGYDVIALASTATEMEVSNIKELGASYIDVPVFRTSMNPFTDLKTKRFYQSIFTKEQPSHVISYTIKPIVWAGIALNKVKDCHYTALITGLGYAFEGKGLKRWLLRWAATKLYKKSLKRANKVIFQNSDDLNYFLKRGVVSEDKTYVVSGSGVPMEHFKQETLPNSGLTFLMIARLLKEKGVYQYVEAARKVKLKHPNIKFHLLGRPEESPDGINKKVVSDWEAEGVIEYLGETNDVRPYLKDCHAFVLPSYYREGLPRTILEAMATGRAILTTDNVGCREPISEGVNGFLVPVKNSEVLADRIRWFINNPDRLIEMGDASYKLAVNKYDVHIINKEILQIMELT